MKIILKEQAFNLQKPFIIALDGPSASGKGHIGRELAKEFKLQYFQSSLIYRGLAKLCIEKNINLENILDIINLSQSPDIIEYAKKLDLNSEHIASVASQISIIGEVRENLSKQLIKIINTFPRIIMEGRDIGTIIAPDADLKIFLTADVNIRAQRRYKQLQAEGKNCILSEILAQLKLRDERDLKRSIAPLIPAKDALIIDTSNLTPTQIIETVIKFINGR